MKFVLWVSCVGLEGEVWLGIRVLELTEANHA